MSTPFSGEYGDWHGAEIFEPDHANIPLVKNHFLELTELGKLNSIALDEEYIRLSIENIKLHPVKYARNCLANITRLLFDTPIYFATPTDLYLLRIFPTCVILPFIIIAFFITMFNFKKIPSELKLLFFLTLIYFFLSVLVSPYHRQFYIMVPVFLIFIAYSF